MSLPAGFNVSAVVDAFATLGSYAIAAYLVVCAGNIVFDILRNRR
jgi:hypothetical protein